MEDINQELKEAAEAAEKENNELLKNMAALLDLDEEVE